MKVAVISYGMGNIGSVVNALRVLKANVVVANSPDQLRDAERIVLPGVGAFADGMRNLKSIGFQEALRDEVITRGKPFLGICLGLQLLATRGYEHGEHDGLDWITGEVNRICPRHRDVELRVPHIGWNDVEFREDCALYSGIQLPEVFYFVHSFVLNPKDPGVITGTCDYGGRITASVMKDNVMATQFHPEKSHHAGLAVINNWLNWRLA